jgi:hypothetical protein
LAGKTCYVIYGSICLGNTHLIAGNYLEVRKVVAISSIWFMIDIYASIMPEELTTWYGISSCSDGFELQKLSSRENAIHRAVHLYK